jgi:glucose/arabinose dehydrogenase
MKRTSAALKVGAVVMLGLVIGLAAAPFALRTHADTSNNSPYQWQKVADGFRNPTNIVQPPDGTNRLFITEQPGTIRILQGGKTLPVPFLDVTRKLTSVGNEQGLLGLAFHPDFAKNGVFFIAYTNPKGQPTLARYTVSAADPNVADPQSGKELLSVQHPFPNHNGGQVGFGPDGYLYWGIGDGGSAADPFNNGQNVKTLLGDILRLDVSGDSYTIPPDNPFVSVSGALPELWAIGLRNPWRFSFDQKTGELYIADVGQNQYEEVNVQPAASKGGENYGWSIWEANHRFKDGEPVTPVVFPVTEYSHSDGGCSVTGGYVYRGAALPALAGVYIYGDYCSGEVWTLHRDEAGKWINQTLMGTGLNITTFGQDTAGEIYLADRNSGAILKLVAR